MCSADEAVGRSTPVPTWIGATDEAEYLALTYGDRYMSSGHWPHAMLPACRLLWFRKNDPELWPRASPAHDKRLDPLLLDRALRSEPSNAGETMLFDIARRNGVFTMSLGYRAICCRLWLNQAQSLEG